jgi:hypothetical protein
MKTETGIRIVELGVAISSTYMAAITMIQTSLYIKIKSWLLGYLLPVIASMGANPAFFDIMIVGAVIALSFLSWRKADIAGFGRIFSLNMLMFFPAVIDYSMFNWVTMIMPYGGPENWTFWDINARWVFGVGLLLQATYLTLSYTARFKGVRKELIEREAELADIDEVSKGQMIYLAELVISAVVLSIGVYYGVPYISKLISSQASGLPFPHIIIGVVTSLIIASAIILYLRSGEKEEPLINEEEEPTEENSEEF